MRSRKLWSGVVALLLLEGAAHASDLSRRIARYDYRSDRREMSGLLSERRAAAVQAGELVAAFREQSSAQGISTRLSSGDTIRATPVTSNALGGDQVVEKRRDWAAFESRPPRINDPAIYMDTPDALRVLTAPIERVLSSVGTAYPYYYSYAYPYRR